MSATFSRRGAGTGVFTQKAGGSAYFTLGSVAPPPPPTPTDLLSQLPTSIGAFSLRAVSGTLTLAVRVRRSTDNATQDFYADQSCNLTTVSSQTLASWLGAATGYVTTWYDQSGAGNHAVQNTTANQPVIAVSTKGPGYMITLNGSTQYLTLTSAGYSLLNGINYTLNMVTQRTASKSTLNYVFGTNTQNGNFQNAGIGFENNTTISPLGNLTNTGGTQLTIAGYNASNEPAYYVTGAVIPTRVGYSNATVIGTNSNAGLLQVPSGATYSFGYVRNGQNFFYYTGNVFEFLIFSSGLNQSQVTLLYNNQYAVYGA
jgi:hypothetical protein